MFFLGCGGRYDVAKIAMRQAKDADKIQAEKGQKKGGNKSLTWRACDHRVLTISHLLGKVNSIVSKSDLDAAVNHTSLRMRPYFSKCRHIVRRKDDRTVFALSFVKYVLGIDKETEFTECLFSK